MQPLLFFGVLYLMFAVVLQLGKDDRRTIR